MQSRIYHLKPHQAGVLPAQKTSSEGLECRSKGQTAGDAVAGQDGHVCGAACPPPRPASSPASGSNSFDDQGAEIWENVRACLSNHISTREASGYGVIGVEVYKRDVVVIKGLKPGVVAGAGGIRWTPSKRGAIEELSARARLRMLHTVKNSDVNWQSLICLTYPAEFPSDGRTVKANLNAFLTVMRRKFGEGVSYLWFLEFQRRGAPHLHMFCDVEPSSALRAWISVTWYRIVGSRDIRHLRAGTQWSKLRHDDGAFRYAAKYACKPSQKMVPEGYRDVGRFWGASRNVKATPEEKIAMCADELIDRLAFSAARFCADGKFRKYLWDLAEVFREGFGREWAFRPLNNTT